MRLFVFFHVMTMFSAVALAGGGEILLLRIARSRDVPAIRSAFDAHRRLGALVPGLFLLGFAFGVVAIFVDGFDPLQGWLLLAYPTFVAGMAVGAAVIGPWVKRVAIAAAASGDAISTELDAALADPRGRWGQLGFWAITVAIVFIMVVKPLS